MTLVQHTTARSLLWLTLLSFIVLNPARPSALAGAQIADGSANCKPTVGYQYLLNLHVYIGTGLRGADALTGKVYYSVSAIDITKRFRIDGTFWVYAYECRTLAYLSDIPAERWSVAERPVTNDDNDCGGDAGGFYIQQPGYDPAYDTSPGGAGGCSGGGGDGPDDPWGSDGPEPTVTVGDSGSGAGCHVETITIDISYDNGGTWSVFYSGDVRVC
jgi:hypothetical protein